MIVQFKVAEIIEFFNGSDIAEMFSEPYFNTLERLGMFDKMNNKNFWYSDMQKEKAIQRLVKQKL